MPRVMEKLSHLTRSRRPLQTLAGRVQLLSAVMCMAKQAQYSKMSDYRPKLPSNNAYDYYILQSQP